MGYTRDEKEPESPRTLVDDSLSVLSEIEEVHLHKEKDRQEAVSDNSSAHSTTTISQSVRDADHPPDLERVATQKNPTTKVPRQRRRGLFARFAIVPEVTEPHDYSNHVKWFITFVVAIAAAAAPVGSGIIFPTIHQVMAELHTDATTANLAIALYMLAMAIFPLWWSAFSETSGRRTIYMVSFALFILFSALSAISSSIAMLVVLRMLSGGAAASVQAVGAGTIADVWEPRERGRAMGMFYLGPLCGPLLAPIVGGALGEYLGWRATQWAQAVFGILIWIFIFFALPETLKDRKDLAQEEAVAAATTNLPNRASTKQSTTASLLKWLRVAKRLFLDPLKIIQYLRFPAVFLTVYYASVTFGSLYILNVSIQYTFEKPPYEFSTLILGLLYLPNSIGYIMASMFGGRWMDNIMAREATKANRIGENGKLIYRPEDRMRENAWLGAVLYPAALLWYGWSAEKGAYWLVPMIANFFYGIGSMLIFAMATTMLTEFMPRKSSSGVALNNLIRNIFSCVGSIVGAPLIASIGNGWLFTILGIWALSSTAVIWAMRRFGPRWREKMDKALE